MSAITKTLGAVGLVCVLCSCGGGGGGSDSDPGGRSTPTPTPTPSPTATATPTVTVTPTPTATPTPTPTPFVIQPDTTADPALPSSTSSEYATAQEAARFLTQASFGPTAKSLVALMSQTQEEWIDEQIAFPQTIHLELLEDRYELIGLARAPDQEDDEEGWVRDIQRSDIWWESAVWGQDQLRQRVAYALSQILVISNVSDALFNDSRGIANYHDILAEHAFGNYRDLLEAVTLNPIMGEYLSMIRNQKANPEANIRPDENYAREIMQLFSIGLVELNTDGSVRLDENDQPIPTYGQEDIKELARVFTGWYHGTIDIWWQWVTGGDSEIVPMKPFPEFHDDGEKTLFGDQLIPAGQTAQEDIDSALDILFAHDNVAPFISKQLIQRLVTSNPSPAYVERVANIFNNNGAGEKGDLEAVVKAILLDTEARQGHVDSPETFGKLKEPILKITALWRAFKAQGVPVQEANGSIYRNRLRYRATDRNYGQRPYGSFSVFNFYRPDFQMPGEIKDAGLYSPEFQIHTESQMISATNNIGGTIFWRDTENDWPRGETIQSSWDSYPTQLYLAQEKDLAENPADLLDKINLLLMAGSMSEEMYNAVLEFANAMPNGTAFAREVLTYDMLFLVTASPEFAVQR